jgi:hypothetical protein
MHPGGAIFAAGAGLFLAALIITLDETAALFGAATRPAGSTQLGHQTAAALERS